MYPTGASSPRLYGLPKIHKMNNPLRLMVSSRGSVTCGLAKELARILKPLIGNTIHHVNNSKEFADDMKKTGLENLKCIISYDVSAIFTSIPVTSAIPIIKNKLEQHTELHKKKNNVCQQYLGAAGFCLCYTYFLFQGQVYEQTKGAAIRPPVNPIVANLYMESFEHRAPNISCEPSKVMEKICR